MYKVEKGIPLPEKQPRTKHPSYPLGELDVDESLFIPREDLPVSDGVVRAQATSLGKREGKRFRASKQDGGVRVWRVA